MIQIDKSCSEHPWFLLFLDKDFMANGPSKPNRTSTQKINVELMKSGTHTIFLIKYL